MSAPLSARGAASQSRWWLKRSVVASVLVAFVVVMAVLVVIFLTRGFSWRDRVPVVEASLLDQTQLTLVVDTCGGDPEVDLFEEQNDVVKVAVVSTRRVGGPGGMDCLDAVTVQLQDPLAGRPVVDVTTGDEVAVA